MRAQIRRFLLSLSLLGPGLLVIPTNVPGQPALSENTSTPIVMYTGAIIHDISDFNWDAMTYMLDVSIWFRYQGTLDLKRICFLNAVEPIQLGEPVKTRHIEHTYYALYRLNGYFKADFLPQKPPLEQHDVGLSLYHLDYPYKALRFVVDVQGMNSWINNHSSLAVAGWNMDAVQRFHSILLRHPLGAPNSLDDRGGIHHSRFNLVVRIKKEGVSLRDIVPSELILPLLLLSLLGLSLSAVGKHLPALARLSDFWIFCLQIVCTGMLLMTAEQIVLTRLNNAFNAYYVNQVVLVFDILWWVCPAILFNIAIERFIWHPLEHQTQRVIPNLMRRMTAFIIYLLAFFGIVAFVFKQTLTGLLATSGVIAMIVGLAVQINITNIFSGIALNVEQPFRLGDWVRIGPFGEGEAHEGKVIDMTWRTTRLQTGAGNILSLSNGMVSEAVIYNFSAPNLDIQLDVGIQIDPSYAPRQIQGLLLNAALSVKTISKPWVAFEGTKGTLAQYRIFFTINDYSQKHVYLNHVLRRVWTHLYHAGIVVALREIDRRASQEKLDHINRQVEKPLQLLNRFEIFRILPEAARCELSSKIQRCLIPPGEPILKQGQAGNSLFILVSGVTGIWVTLEDGSTLEVARRGAGDIIGEIALLTGEVRTASVIAMTDTVYYEITKHDIAPYLEAQPELAERLSDILAVRQLETQSVKDLHQTTEEDKQALSKDFLHRIRHFFGLTNEEQSS